MSMPRESNDMQVDLSPDLVAFIAENSGPGTPFSSASEFIAAVLQEKREMLDPLRTAEFAVTVERNLADDWLRRLSVRELQIRNAN